MPIQELVDFFNDRFHEMAVRYLPDEPLRLRGDQVTGQFYGYRIHSRFRPLVGASDRTTTSHDACTHVTNAVGRAPAVVDLFDAANEAGAVVYVDRLCRLVHMLNYLVLSEHYAALSLPVEPRHVLSVRDDHGRYFEDVLQRCGLAPSQVVITLNGGIRGTETAALIRGLENYRRNGYRIATMVDRTKLALDGSGILTDLRPDFARLDGAFLHAALSRSTVASEYHDVVDRLRGIGISIIQDDVDSDTQARFAAAAGVAQISGRIAGRPSTQVYWNRINDAQTTARPPQARFLP